MVPNRSMLRTRFGTWCVNDIDIVIFPHGVGSSRLDGDASLSLKLHGVHSGSNTILSLHLQVTEHNGP